MKKTLRPGDVIVLIVMLSVLAVVIFPFLWLVLSSLKVTREIIQYPPSLLPSRFTFVQYVKVWESIPLLSFFYQYGDFCRRRDGAFGIV